MSEKLEQSLRALFRRQLRGTGAFEIFISPDEDHEGEPILLVEVNHRLVDHPIDLKKIIETDRAARDLAWEEGERRFLHVEHIYDEKQQVAPA